VNLGHALSQKIAGVAAWKLGVGTVGAVLIYRRYAGTASAGTPTDTGSSETPIDPSYYYPATGDQLIPDTTGSTDSGGAGGSSGGDSSGGTAAPGDALIPGDATSTPQTNVVVPGIKDPRKRKAHKKATPAKSRSKATVHTGHGKRPGGRHKAAKPSQPRHKTEPQPVTRKRATRPHQAPATHQPAAQPAPHSSRRAGRTRPAHKPPPKPGRRRGK
jgi:hypothetical protein